LVERPALRAGLFLGQAGADWATMLARFQLAERLGFDYAYLVDHILDTDGPERAEVPILEAWTLLSALAARTSRIRLGVLVTSNTFRHPGLLAKQAVTVDHVSGGRLDLGIGTGWYEEEHRRFGIPLAPPAERVDALEEALEIIRRLLGGEWVSHDGRHYHMEEAPLRPRPVQQPLPLLVAAHRPRMLALAARYADIWDTFPTLERSATASVDTDLAERVKTFEAACRAIGRDPDTVRRSTWTGSDEAESVDAYRAWAERMLRLGFTDLTCSLPAEPDESVLGAISTDVVPELRERARAMGQPAG
jgi:alkanesulfonate monooxygenase SsuD/methylene tetrahydromethanopterin reductase-like flavin-dependent oxidoreductase (luciferase family)